MDASFRKENIMILYFQLKKEGLCLLFWLLIRVIGTSFFVASSPTKGYPFSAFLSSPYPPFPSFSTRCDRTYSLPREQSRLNKLLQPNEYLNNYYVHLTSLKSKQSWRKENQKQHSLPNPQLPLNSTTNETLHTADLQSIDTKSTNTKENERISLPILNNIFSKKSRSNVSMEIPIVANGIFKNPWENNRLDFKQYNKTYSYDNINERELPLVLNEMNLRIEKLQEIIKGQDTVIRQLTSFNYQQRQKELKEKVAPSKLFKLDFDKIKDTYIDPGQVALFSGLTGSIIGSILARSVARNLSVLGWFLCGCVSSYFGYIGSKYEAGGVLGNIMAYIGIMLSKKYNETTFLYKSGRLSYVYYQEFEKYDRKYKLMDKWKKFELFTQGQLKEAEKFEKRYEIMNRISSFGTGIITLGFDGLQSAFNAKDRKDLGTKIKTALPYRVRKHFMTKKQRKIEREKKYRVKFCGQRVWPDFGEEII